MHQLNGTNPRSVVVTDNLSVHHTNPVIELFNQACIPTFFLPPYSPDLNPAKECFSYVKNYLRKHDTLLQMVRDPTPIIRAGFFSVTKDHSTSWIQHSEYYKILTRHKNCTFWNLNMSFKMVFLHLIILYS